MPVFANPFAAPSEITAAQASSKLLRLCTVVLFCLCSMRHARASATLLLEEPYSYDGAFAGTGHVAVYLNHVCALSPIVLRLCEQGETGVVLSRYDGIGGYDWIAIPLIPYLYAVEQPDEVPLFADAKLVAFLRDQYRRQHLEAFAPDLADGGTPQGNWYELIGSSYDRTIYGFEIETTPEQDALLIQKLNSEPNRQRYNFIKRNCADFVRQIIDFYYPHALHRSMVGDLGVTTPKQIAKMMVKYGHHHPDLESSDFLVPQVPGTVPRSKPIHGVLESVMAAKKYMLPLVALHPYIGGGLLVEYFGHQRFDPARNALILDSRHQLDLPMTREQRVAYQSRLNEMMEADSLSQATGTKSERTKSENTKVEGKNIDAGLIEATNASGKNEATKNKKEEKSWERLQASAQPGFDASGKPVLRIGGGDDAMEVGLTRDNILILSGSESPELAAKLIEARLHQELRSSTARKVAPGDVDMDFKLLQQALATQAGDIASFARRLQAAPGLQ